jgi:hypothetical protein
MAEGRTYVLQKVDALGQAVGGVHQEQTEHAVGCGHADLAPRGKRQCGAIKETAHHPQLRRVLQVAPHRGYCKAVRRRRLKVRLQPPCVSVR